jgi:hypothetical protein
MTEEVKNAIKTLVNELKTNETLASNWRDQIATQVSLSFEYHHMRPTRKDLETILMGANIFMEKLIKDAQEADENNEYDNWIFNTKENLSKKYLEDNNLPLPKEE